MGPMMDLQRLLLPESLPWGRAGDQGAEPHRPLGHRATPWYAVSPRCPMCQEGLMATAPRSRCLLFPNPA